MSGNQTSSPSAVIKLIPHGACGGVSVPRNYNIMNTDRIVLDAVWPEMPEFKEGIRRAPDRGYTLTPEKTVTALKNALRYLPKELHEKAAPEFLEELRTRGRIYGYRWRPAGDLKAKPIDEYKGKCLAGKAFQVMIDNNLCFDVALYPYELVTYGETGQVCQNWLQYRLIKKYLENRRSRCQETRGRGLPVPPPGPLSA